MATVKSHCPPVVDCSTAPCNGAAGGVPGPASTMRSIAADTAKLDLMVNFIVSPSFLVTYAGRNQVRQPRTQTVTSSSLGSR
jgi:hypothetical protein